MTVLGVLLAAGGGTRFTGGSHKLLADLRGRAVVQWSIEHLMTAGLDHALVVSGAVAIDVPAGTRVIDNPLWATGQASSLHVALGVAEELGAEFVVVGLGDQPFVEPSAWRAVASAPPTCTLAVATYGGVRGPNPVRIARALWPLLPTTGDEGARPLLREHPAWVCEVACLGSAADIDTLEDLERWTNC